MRITEGMKYASAVRNMDAATARMAKAGSVAASGERVQDPSDDPAAWSTAHVLDARVALAGARSANAKQSASELDTAEGALASANDLLVRAKEIALSASNATVDAASRAAAATEVDTIRQQLIAIGNTRGATGYLFGGNATGTLPFDASGKFVGDDGVRSIEIGDGRTARVNASGAKALTAAGGRDVLGDLAQLSADMKSNNVAGVTGSLDTLESDRTQVAAARIDAGTQSGQLKSAADILDGLSVSLQQSRSQAADADVTTAYSELTASQQSYESALAVTQRILAATSPFANGG